MAITTLIIYATVFIFIYILYKIGLSKKINKIDKNKAIINKFKREGKVYAKKLKLKNLYSSTENLNNCAIIGKITACVSIKEDVNSEERNTLFITKDNSGIESVYYVKEIEHSKLEGDVTVRVWNWIENNGILIKNKNKIMSPDEVKTKELGINVLEGFNKYMSNAIELDSRYRKEKDLQGLMKEPE